ncbi:MAG: hypothetical protein KF764_06930 [Labilithrix sp.]|nr:hypothetical protein [Labilithrix sp.]MBX3219371.1 hypothetical protein [Labilithrix sp.]
MKLSGLARLGAALLVATASALSRGAPSASASPTGSAPRAPALSDEGCIGCHADAARTWEGSLHHASASNSAYEIAVYAEPLAFCRRCHAPHGDPSRETSEAARQAGITCTTCHLRPGDARTVLSSPRERPIAAPHGVERSAALGQAVCARCHEFDFPDARGERMQKTATEHRASAHAATSCASCHMPQENGRRSHAFAASRDAAVLTRAVSVRADRDGDRVRFVLEPEGVGHAFPTGDLFRRLTLTVMTEDAAGRRLATKRRYFGRVFGPVKSGAEIVRREIADERLFARTEVTFALDPHAVPTTVRWQLDYERVAFSPTRQPEEAVVEGSITLARGTLGPHP